MSPGPHPVLPHEWVEARPLQVRPRRPQPTKTAPGAATHLSGVFLPFAIEKWTECRITRKR